MGFSDVGRELRQIGNHLPAATSLANAYLLAELACICHSRLNRMEKSAEFWGQLDPGSAKRLQRFLRDADDGVSNAANDLWHIASDEEPSSLKEVI